MGTCKHDLIYIDLEEDWYGHIGKHAAGVRGGLQKVETGRMKIAERGPPSVSGVSNAVERLEEAQPLAVPQIQGWIRAQIDLARELLSLNLAWHVSLKHYLSP